MIQMTRMMYSLIFRPFGARTLSTHRVTHISRTASLNNAQNASNTRLYGKPPTTVSTLLPEELLPSDLLDLSGLKEPTISFFSNDAKAKVVYHESTLELLKFPPETKGFLYFHRLGPHAPLATCSMRFRICESKEEFGTGQDLLARSGFPWRKSMDWIIKNGLADTLAKSGVISPNLLEPYSKAFPPRSLDGIKIMVYAFNQTFPLVLKCSTTTFNQILVVGEDAKVRLYISYPNLKKYLRDRGIEEVTLRVHLEHDKKSVKKPIIVRLSENAFTTGGYLEKGRILPVTISGGLKRHDARSADQVVNPVHAALKILQRQEERALGLL